MTTLYWKQVAWLSQGCLHNKSEPVEGRQATITDDVIGVDTACRLHHFQNIGTAAEAKVTLQGHWISITWFDRFCTNSF